MFLALCRFGTPGISLGAGLWRFICQNRILVRGCDIRMYIFFEARNKRRHPFILLYCIKCFFALLQHRLKRVHQFESICKLFKHGVRNQVLVSPGAPLIVHKRACFSSSSIFKVLLRNAAASLELTERGPLPARQTSTKSPYNNRVIEISTKLHAISSLLSNVADTKFFGSSKTNSF